MQILYHTAQKKQACTHHGYKLPTPLSNSIKSAMTNAKNKTTHAGGLIFGRGICAVL